MDPMNKICPDTSSLLSSMAPRLRFQPWYTPPGAPRLPNSHHPHGQAQAHLGPVYRLRRLRSRNRLYRRLRHGKKDAAKTVLQADYETGSVEIIEYGGHDEEMGRRRDIEESGQWDVAEEQTEKAKIGEVER